MFKSLNKKISTLSAIAIIVLITLLVGGILVWRYWETPKATTPPVEFSEVAKGQVVITTDKTEYGQGEIIKITIKNDLNKSIWYVKELCPLSCCNLYKLENNEWKNLGDPMPCIQLTPPPSGKPYHFEADELKPGENIAKQWDIKIETSFSESGKYRFSFYYGLSKDNYTEKTIYSNAFTIKEKVEKETERCIEQCKGKPDGTQCTYGVWCDQFGRICGGQSCVGLGMGKCLKKQCVSDDDYKNLLENPQVECLGSCKCMKKCNAQLYYFIPAEEGNLECSGNLTDKTCCCSGV